MHTLLENFIKKKVGDRFVHFPSSNICKSCGNAFWRGESFPRHKITCHSPLCPACRPSAITVARTSLKIPACLMVIHVACRPSKTLHERYHLPHYLQDKVQLQAAHEKCRSSAGTWTCRCQGRVCWGINVVAGWNQ